MGRIHKRKQVSRKTTSPITESPVDEHDSTSDSSEESKSSFLGECEHAFGTNDLYLVLNLEKDRATASDIKRAYYKLSLKFHPDKVADESKKHESKEKFQILGKIYSILSDDEKKKIYDETGCVDGEDEFFGANVKNWEAHWRNMFKKVTTEDVDEFFEKYRTTDEEKNDLLKLYKKHEGNMDLILEEMFSQDSMEDEPRFKEIIREAIKNGHAEEYDNFTKESKKKASKRKAKFEKEAEEAEKIRKEMGVDESQDGLRKAILARREKESTSFLDHLANKYSKKGKAPKKEDQESENEESESDQESEQEVSVSHKTKKKSPLVKRKAKNSTKVSNKGKAIQKKVKRL
ncbi:dnaJ -like protein [Brachionus plicatilis]|uniref:DnaJ-like protein n=1 Tax=Brachionus plicatilis TaxID=10195 RepID=A0A3M7QAJ6_BRAPC|nr:dnaJ -like protein [Brachionus plicatilis]